MPLASPFAPFRAVVADSLSGEHPEFKRTMWQADIPSVLAVKPSQVVWIVWTPPPEPESPWEAADRLRWEQRHDAQRPGAWTPVVRRFHDGHEETWWAVDLRLGSYAPEYPTRLVVATADPRTLPAASTWYLVTNLPLPGTTRASEHPTLPAADLAEVVRLYGVRQWVEQGYKQVKQELGWADFQVRADRAIRRHWELICCAFCFCWWAEGQRSTGARRPGSAPLPALPAPLPLAQEPGAGGKWGGGGLLGCSPRDLADRAHHLLAAAVLATRTTAGAELA